MPIESVSVYGHLYASQMVPRMTQVLGKASTALTKKEKVKKLGANRGLASSSLIVKSDHRGM